MSHGRETGHRPPPSRFAVGSAVVQTARQVGGAMTDGGR